MCLDHTDSFRVLPGPEAEWGMQVRWLVCLPGRWQRFPRALPSELTHVAPREGVPTGAHHALLHGAAPPVQLGAVLMVHHGQQGLLQLVWERPTSCGRHSAQWGGKGVPGWEPQSGVGVWGKQLF